MLGKVLMLAETVAQTDGQTLPIFIYRFKRQLKTFLFQHVYGSIACRFSCRLVLFYMYIGEFSVLSLVQIYLRFYLFYHATHYSA